MRSRIHIRKRLWVILAVLPIVLSGCLSLAKDNTLGLDASWKEEVVLHDGGSVIVRRSQSYGGYPTIDSRNRIVAEETWTFVMPGTQQEVTWTTDGCNPPQGKSLMLMLLDFVNGVPYIATSPTGCLAYNHWGRPNPPYVFFKYTGQEWQRVPLAEFPEQLKEVNVALGRPDKANRSGLLSSATIKQENNNLDIELRRIIREPIKPGSNFGSSVNCEEMVFYKGAWVGPGDSIGKRLQDRKSKNKENNQ